MFYGRSKLLPCILRAVFLLVFFVAGEMTLGSSASACNYGNNGEVSGGCGNVTPPPPPPNPCTGSCCSGDCCDNGGECCGGGGGGGNGPSGGNSSARGKPVSLFTGQENMTVTDLVVNGTFSISVSRSYDSGSQYDSPVGYGWALSIDKRLYKYADNSVVIRSGCGTRNKYLLAGGTYQWQGKGRRPSLVEQSDGSFVLSFTGGGRETYDAQGKLTIKQDARGNRLEFSYDSRGRLPLTGSSPFAVNPATPSVVAYDYRLTKVEERLADGTLTGNSVTLTYTDSTGRLQKIAANDGRQVSYQYDATTSAKNGNLTSVTGLAGINSIYQYNDTKWTHAVTSIQHGSSTDTPYVNTYDVASGKITKQTLGQDGYDFTYSPLQTAVKHTVRNSAGTTLAHETTTFVFDADGYTKSTEWVLSTTAKYKKEYTRNSSTNLVDNEKLSEQAAGASAYSVTSSIDYKYDAANNKTEEKVTLASGEVVTKIWTYDNGWKSSEQVVSSLDPTKIFRTEYTFFYDANGKPSNIKERKRRLDNGSFLTTTYAYNANGRVQSITYPDGQIQENIYTGDKLTETHWKTGGTVLASMKTTYGYDAKGNRNAITDAKGNLTKLEYDDQRRVVKITNALNQETYFRYTGKLLFEIEHGRTAADGAGQIIQQDHTAEGWLKTVKKKKDDGSFITVASFTYNSAGKPLTSVSYRDGVAYTATNEYDALGRLTKATDPKSNVTQYRYDAMDNRVAIVDAKSRETAYTFDALNRLTKIEQKGVTPSAITQFTYNASGKLLTVTDPESHITSYTYDSLSRRTQVTQPLSQSVTYHYNNRDLVDYVVNARGRKTTYAYWPWGAAAKADYYPDQTATAPTKTVNYGYDNSGNLSSVKDSAISSNPVYQTTYDALNRADVVTVNYLPTAATLDNDYDRYGNRNKITLQDGAPTISSFTYNKLNQLSVISLPGSQTFGVSYYQDAGLIKQLTYPSGVATTYLYENSGMLQAIKTTGTAGALDELNYIYDPALNIETMASTRDGGTHTYGYDGLDHLTSAARPTGYGIANESYSYDDVGNRELADLSQYDYDSNNRITKSPGLTYGYDVDGNQTTRSDGATLTYDADNRLTQYAKGSTTAAYVYDPSGRRIKKTVGTTVTYYLWDGSVLLGEYNGAGANLRRYAYLPEAVSPIQVRDSNGTYSAHQDHLQTTRLLTDGTQKIVWSQKQSAFGSMQVNGDPDGNGVSVTFNGRFPGQFYDAESGLIYNYFRDYDPVTGRYIESDPIGLAGGINAYAYVNGNPLSYIDPLGLLTECERQSLQEVLNRHSSGPHVGPNDIATDPSATRGYGHNRPGGPIVVHTNPSQPDQYSGSVTSRGRSAGLIGTGMHENAHRGQNTAEHAIDAIIETVTGGNISDAQDAADEDMSRAGDILNEFNELVDQCRRRRCGQGDPDLDN